MASEQDKVGEAKEVDADEGGPSWQRAAANFLATHRPEEGAWAGPFLLQPQEIRALAGFDPNPHQYLLVRLLQLPCKCKTKCSWLPTRQLTIEELTYLDRSPWGARILAESALVLGLQMQTPVGTGLQGVATRTKINSAVHRQLNFARGAIKATARAALLSQAITPLPQRTLAFTAWIQSVTYYPASIAVPLAQLRSQLRRQYADLVFNMHWLKAAVAHPVLRLLRIASGTSTDAALDLAVIGFAFRRFAPAALFLGPCPAAKALKQRVTVLLLALQPYSTPEHWRAFVDRVHQADATRPDLVPKLLQYVKYMQRTKEDRSALAYLCKRSQRAFPAEATPRLCWLALADASVKHIPPHARIALARWWLKAEADDSNYIRQLDLPPLPHCGICGPPTLATQHPWGKTQSGVCGGHPEYHQFWQHNAGAALENFLEENFGAWQLPDIDQPDILPEPDPPLPSCVLCANGPNTVSHLQRHCSVSNAILTCALGRIAAPRDWYTSDPAEVVILAHTVHALRRELLARRAYSGGRVHERVPLPAGDVLPCVRRLLAEIGAALPPHYDRHPLLAAPVTICSPCPQEFYHVRSAPAAHFAHQVVPRRSTKHMHLVTLRRTLPHEPLMFTHADTFPTAGVATQEQWLPPPAPSSTPYPSARIVRKMCTCGANGWLLLANNILPADAILNVAPVAPREFTNLCPSGTQAPQHEQTGTAQTADSGSESFLILQFDGSCKRPTATQPCAGAGVAAWFIQENSTVLVDHCVLPLPQARNAQEAEAGGAAEAVVMAARLVASLQPTHLEFQGDNKGVIGYWTGHSRFRGDNINNLLMQARELSLYSLPFANWEYIPRECNGTADHLAGVASTLVQLARDEDGAEGLGPMRCFLTAEIQLPHLWHMLREAFAHPATPSFILPEIADHIQWGALTLLQKLLPQQTKSLPALYAVALKAPSGTPYLVHYGTRTRIDHFPYGRRYPDSPGGAKLGRTARYILYGRCHEEYDIRGSHFAVFLALLNKLDPGLLQGPFESITAAREFLTSQLNGSRYAHHHPDSAKALLNVSLNTATHKVTGRILAWNCGLPAPLLDFFRQLQALKLLVHAAFVLPWEDPRRNEDNSLYFVLEHYEAIFMRTFAKYFLTYFEPLSMLWIHDGIWLHPSPPELLMQQAEQHAQHVTGMELQFAHKSLLQDHVAALASLQRVPLQAHKIPPTFEQLRTLGHQEWWEQAHRGPGQLPAVVHKQLKHATAPPTIDPCATLHNFFVRTGRQ